MKNKQDTLSVSKATSMLINLILHMPPKAVIETLRDLEKKYPSASGNVRGNPRSEVMFVSEGRLYKGLVSMIHSQGMFIETQDKFCLGDCLSLSFEYKTAEKQVKAAGKVCKVNRHGIGVEFDADISSYLRN